MHFKPNILPASMASWARKGDAYMAGSVAIVPEGGSLSYQLLLDNDTLDKAVSSMYRLEITYNTIEAKDFATIDAMFTVDVLRDENYPHTKVSLQVRPKPNEDKKIIRYFEASGGTLEKMELRFINHSSKTPYEIAKIELFPSYDLDDATLEEVDKLIPSIQHFENTKTIAIAQEETLLADAKLEVAEDTNLLMHLILNFTYPSSGGEPPNLNINFLLDEGELPYSPLGYSVHPGFNLLSLPLNIMNIPKGLHKLRITATSSGETVYIERYKMQMTLDGKNLISRTESSAPSAFEQEYIAPYVLEPIEVTDNPVSTDLVEVIRMGVSQVIKAARKGPLGYLTATTHVSQVAVAEAVFFDSQDRYDYFGATEPFVVDGSLHLKPSEMASRQFTEVFNFNYGDVFALDLDNTYVGNYTHFLVEPVLRSIERYNVPLTTDNFEVPSTQYEIRDNQLVMKTMFEKAWESSTMTENSSWALVELDTEEFSEIKIIQ